MNAIDDLWQLVDRDTPAKAQLLVWSGGCRFAIKDQHGQWRGVLGRPIKTPTHWQPMPKGPRSAVGVAAGIG